jgi:hypothetical protein
MLLIILTVLIEIPLVKLLIFLYNHLYDHKPLRISYTYKTYTYDHDGKENIIKKIRN